MSYKLQVFVALTILISAPTTFGYDNGSNKSLVVDFVEKVWTGEKHITLPANTHFVKTEKGMTILARHQVVNRTIKQKACIPKNIETITFPNFLSKSVQETEITLVQENNEVDNVTFKEKKIQLLTEDEEKDTLITMEEHSVAEKCNKTNTILFNEETAEVVEFKPNYSLVSNERIENAICTQHQYNNQPVYVTNSQTIVAATGTMNTQRIITGIAGATALFALNHKQLHEILFPRQGHTRTMMGFKIVVYGIVKQLQGLLWLGSGFGNLLWPVNSSIFDLGAFLRKQGDLSGKTIKFSGNTINIS
jgi:hypothetical protein